MLLEVFETRWHEKTRAKYFFHWTSALFSKIFVFNKVVNVTEMKHAQNLREVFVRHKKLFAAIAKLDVTRKGSQICFQWNFARFSKPAKFFLDYNVEPKRCYRKPAKLDDTRKRGQNFFHWTPALFSEIFVFNKVLNVTEIRHAQNLREFFVRHKKLLADIAKLDVTRRGSQICFQWNFARFSTPCVFNEVLGVT